MGLALLEVVRTNKLSFYPEAFLKAAGEMLFVLILTCWILTAIFNPDIFHDNPMIVRIGYNNLCIGFDSPPATYVGMVLFCPCVYLLLRYSFTDMERTSLVRERLTSRQVSFSYATDAMMAISICVFGLVFVISPMVMMRVRVT